MFTLTNGVCYSFILANEPRVGYRRGQINIALQNSKPHPSRIAIGQDSGEEGGTSSLGCRFKFIHDLISSVEKMPNLSAILD